MRKGLVDPITGTVWVDHHKPRDWWVRKVIKHGAQMMVNIPMDLLREMRLEHGAYVMFLRENGVITFRVMPIVKTREELEDL